LPAPEGAIGGPWDWRHPTSWKQTIEQIRRHSRGTPRIEMRSDGPVSLRSFHQAAPRGNLPEGMFERPIAPEGTTHRTNDETKEGTTSDRTARLSEEKQYAPRPSILAPAIAVSLQPRRERTKLLMETHVPSSGLAASARRLLFDRRKTAGPVCRSRSFNEPVLLQTNLSRVCMS
jgi:hypothetical protein